VALAASDPARAAHLTTSAMELLAKAQTAPLEDDRLDSAVDEFNAAQIKPNSRDVADASSARRASGTTRG
jgi:hypothetical protein